MNYFEHDLSAKPNFSFGRKQKWILDKPYTQKKNLLKIPFTKQEYLKNTIKFSHFQYMNSEFFCADSECRSENVKCIWYLYQGIDLGVDDTFAEFYCPDCGKYTFVEYNRDSS